jgi:prepilin-type N-terminal cleavage/methylation domain-containing protein
MNPSRTLPESRQKRGFTLGEVLVTVAIVAVLAAVVIPSIGSQITKGELGRTTSDLLTMRSAIEQFLGDVRKYPRNVQQLTTSPVASTAGWTDLVNTAQYTAQEVARWRGPYINKDSSAALTTGYGLSIQPLFETITLGVTGTTNGTGIKYAAVIIQSMDQATATSLDVAMDDGAVTSGSLRWVTGSPSKLYLLAIPVQP